MSKEIRYLPRAELRIEPAGDGQTPKTMIVGYAAVFNSSSVDLGGFREFISPGAFTRTLREGADVRALVDHNSTLLLGRNKSGTLRLKPNAKGLLVEIDPPDTQAGRDVIESLRRGDLDGMSFAFRTVHDEWHTEDGLPVRELLDVELLDVSVVTYPAYPATEVALRSLEAWRTAEAAPPAPPADDPPTEPAPPAGDPSADSTANAEAEAEAKAEAERNAAAVIDTLERQLRQSLV